MAERCPDESVAKTTVAERCPDESVAKTTVAERCPNESVANTTVLDSTDGEVRIMAQGEYKLLIRKRDAGPHGYTATMGLFWSFLSLKIQTPPAKIMI